MYTYFVSSVDRVVDGDTVDVIIDLGFDLTKEGASKTCRHRYSREPHKRFRRKGYGS